MGAYTPKPYLNILSELIDHARSSTDQLTDFNPGSVTRTWLECTALAADELWMGAMTAVESAIPEAVFKAFGFSAYPAVRALGTVTFSLSAPATVAVTIPAGTRIRELGGAVMYETVSPTLIAAGNSAAAAQVRALESGSASNVAANTLNVIMNLTAVNGVSVTNPLPILSGADLETAAARQERFARYIRALSRGTSDALLYAAHTAVLCSDDDILERVQYASMIEVPGRVQLYVHNGLGHTSAALVQRAQGIIDGSADHTAGMIIPGWRAAGVEVVCLPMSDLPVNIAAILKVANGYDAETVIQSAKTSLTMLLRDITDRQLLIPRIVTALYTVPGVMDLTLTSPTSAIEIPPSARLVPGVLQLIT